MTESGRGEDQSIRGVLTEQHVRLEHSFADVWASVFAHPFPHLPAVDGVSDDGMALVGVRLAGVPVYQQVYVEFGKPTVPDEARRLVLPIRWLPTIMAPALPDMEGELAFETLGAERTMMTLTVRYRPPAGRLGEAVDAALMHRFADATASDFVNRVSSALDRELARPR